MENLTYLGFQVTVLIAVSIVDSSRKEATLLDQQHQVTLVQF